MVDIHGLILHADSTLMFLLQMSVPDILKTPQNLFDSVLSDVTKGIQEEDLVQVTLECPDLDFPIRLPLMQMNQLTSEWCNTDRDG
jgi:hypothetical protein